MLKFKIKKMIADKIALMKYFEEIQNNINQGLSPEKFANKCIKDKFDKENILDQSRVEKALKEKKKSKKELLEEDEIKREKMAELAHISKKEFKKYRVENKSSSETQVSESFKAISKMIDLNRG